MVFSAYTAGSDKFNTFWNIDKRVERHTHLQGYSRSLRPFGAIEIITGIGEWRHIIDSVNDTGKKP
jgi:hypothetical protein